MSSNFGMDRTFPPAAPVKLTGLNEIVPRFGELCMTAAVSPGCLGVDVARAALVMTQRSPGFRAQYFFPTTMFLTMFVEPSFSRRESAINHVA
jgi:hypothetical protein